MPIATPEIYNQMLDRAKSGEYAYPAINVTSSQTLSTPRCAASPRRRATGSSRSPPAARSSPPGTQSRTWSSAPSRWPSSPTSSPRSTRSTSRCTPTTARRTSSTARPAADRDLRASGSTGGRNPLFQSHMLDGSASAARREPGDRRRNCSSEAAKREIILEVEVGVVGGEEDGVAHEINEKLYTTPEDIVRDRRGAGHRREGPLHARRHLRQRARRLQAGQRQAAARRSCKDGQDAASQKFGTADSKPFDLVFHGGSGSAVEEIHETLDYGVVKMNVDTDTQYAFTRPIVDHMFKQLRRRAEGRRRGRRQEGLRPALLPQEGRGGMAERVARPARLSGAPGRAGVYGPRSFAGPGRMEA